MNYYFSKIVNLAFDDAIARVTDELRKEGFGVLTEIDVKETQKKKLNVDFRRYKILGACNPPFAYQALQAEDKIGEVRPFLSEADSIQNSFRFCLFAATSIY